MDLCKMTFRFFRSLLFAFVMAASISLLSCSSLREKNTDNFPDVTAEELLSTLFLEEKVGQLFVVCPETMEPDFYDSIARGEKFLCTKVSKSMKESYASCPVGGFLFFGPNIVDSKQLKSFTSDLRALSRIRPIISVDEEGGRIARLAKSESLKIRNVGPMEAVGAGGKVGRARKAGSFIGSYLSEYGFTMDFAPVADVNTNPENIVIGDRAFGSSPALVSKMDAAFLEGLHSRGIKGCLKHFPGHGDTKSDTHLEYVAVSKDWKELADCELIPFIENFAAADAIMIAHVTLSAADSSGYPASLSHEVVTEKLRNELGYSGVILTDALNMDAIRKNYGGAQAALLAFKAGNDILLMPENPFEAYDAVLNAVRTGEISESRLDESLLRILRLKGYR